MEPTEETTSAGRWAFGLTALIAATGLVLNLVLVILAVYPSTATNPHLLGFNGEGVGGVFGRVVDFFSYFTILSNIVVVVMCALLWRGRVRPGVLTRALRMDSLIMITVTGAVFVVLLAPTAKLQGLQYVTNTIEHYVTPILVIVTWIIWGPRRWLTLGSVATAMVLPFAWLAYTLLRGSVIAAYPYPFLNVNDLGLAAVLRNVVGILILGVVLGLVYWGLDRLIGRRSRGSKE